MLGALNGLGDVNIGHGSKLGASRRVRSRRSTSVWLKLVRCMRGKDEWKVVCTLLQLAEALDVIRCTKDHQHSAKFGLKAS